MMTCGIKDCIVAHINVHTRFSVRLHSYNYALSGLPVFSGCSWLGVGFAHLQYGRDHTRYRGNAPYRLVSREEWRWIHSWHIPYRQQSTPLHPSLQACGGEVPLLKQYQSLTIFTLSSDHHLATCSGMHLAALHFIEQNVLVRCTKRPLEKV